MGPRPPVPLWAPCRRARAVLAREPGLGALQLHLGASGQLAEGPELLSRPQEASSAGAGRACQIPEAGSCCSGM